MLELPKMPLGTWALLNRFSQSDTYILSGVWLGVDLRIDTEKASYFLTWLVCAKNLLTIPSSIDNNNWQDL